MCANKTSCSYSAVGGDHLLTGVARVGELRLVAVDAVGLIVVKNVPLLGQCLMAVDALQRLLLSRLVAASCGTSRRLLDTGGSHPQVSSMVQHEQVKTGNDT
jgi:hypothetical protein